MARPKLRLTELAKLQSELKKANQRIVELEKGGFTNERAYDQVKFWETKGLVTTSKSGHLKFRTDIMKMYNENPKLYYKLKQNVATFLGYETSYASKVKMKYEKAKGSIKEKYNLSLTNQEMKDIFSSSAWDKVINRLGYASESVMELAEKSNSQTADELLGVINELAEEKKTIGELEDEFAKRKRRGIKRTWS